MNSDSIIAPPVRIAQEPLGNIYPEEIDFFKDRFIWTGQTKGFYTRRAYEPERDDFGEPFPKWRPFKTRGNWSHFYTELVDAFVQKHLDFHGFHRPLSDWLHTQDDETAFWLGTMAGMHTYHDCIDLDSHDLIGWNNVPTRWHPDVNTHGSIGPSSSRYVPVVRPSLRFFQMAKIIYDRFPDRIWSFSSGNLGFAIWNMKSSSESTHALYRRTQNLLSSVRLSKTEHYPKPRSKAATFGRCHRRPCGMDTGVITSNGILINPIDQIRAFMSSPKTPTFGQILRAWFSQMDFMYDRFLSSGGSVDHRPMKLKERNQLIEECRLVVADVWRWCEEGCPIDYQLIEVDDQLEPVDADIEELQADVSDVPQMETSVPVVFDSTNVVASIDTDVPTFFKTANLKAVAGSGQWVQFVKFLVENGLPCEDKFSEAVSALALWFGFVELYGEDRDRIKHILRSFVLLKHNNMVSRLLADQQSEVLEHVDRIVDNALDKEDDSGKRKFSELRQKRSSGEYKTAYFFEPQILGKQDSPSSPLFPSLLPSYLICRGLIQDTDTNSEWKYVPDDTPLPDDIMDRIRAAFTNSKRQLRINRRTGRYHTIDSITRFFNYLLSGRKPGTRRASGKLLEKMGFPKKTAERKPVIRILVGGGLLHEGSYRYDKTGWKSKQWILDATVIRAMFLSREQQRAAS